MTGEIAVWDTISMGYLPWNDSEGKSCPSPWGGIPGPPTSTSSVDPAALGICRSAEFCDLGFLPVDSWLLTTTLGDLLTATTSNLRLHWQ